MFVIFLVLSAARELCARNLCTWQVYENESDILEKHFALYNPEFIPEKI